MRLPEAGSRPFATETTTRAPVTWSRTIAASERAPAEFAAEHRDLHVAGGGLELVRAEEIDGVGQMLREQRMLPFVAHRRVGGEVVLVRPQRGGEARPGRVHRERRPHGACAEHRHPSHGLNDSRGPAGDCHVGYPSRRHARAAVPPGRRLRARREGEAGRRRLRLLRRWCRGRAYPRGEPARVPSVGDPTARPPRIGIPGYVDGDPRNAHQLPRPRGALGVSGSGASRRGAGHGPRRGDEPGRSPWSSSTAVDDLEGIAAASDAPKWWQLYLFAEPQRSEDMLARVVSSGYRADLLDGRLPGRGPASSRHAERVRDAVRSR